MPYPLTIAQVFDAAVAAERASEQVYQQLQIAFTAHPELAQFWGRFAGDEARHAVWLLGLRARLDRDTLARPVDETAARLVQGAAAFSVEAAIQRVSTLEDAFELANELESNETNAIFQFLIKNFEPDAQMQAFLRDQLDKHVGALIYAAPPAYQEPLIRKEIRAEK